MTAKIVIQAIEFANGKPCPHAGMWVEKFDHEYNDGQGHGVFTTFRDKALTFKSGADALDFYRRQSRVRPLRPDGKPNRPMTGLTVLIGEVP